MAQGWTVNPTAGTITFYEPPAAGVDNIVVNEYASGGTGATDVWAMSAWSDERGWPCEVEFYGDRLVFGGSRTQPQTLWMSQTGDYYNFGRSTPIEDSDAITATLNARKINAIQELIPLDKLIMMTVGGEWKAGGGQDDVLTPSTISFRPQGFYGSANLPAMVVGNSAIFAQSKGFTVRDIAYSFESDGYTGNDLTIFSGHMVYGYQIKAWAFQNVPYSAVWMARSDGKLLSMTYQKDQQVIGWAMHETDGFVEDVCVVPEGNVDAVYVTVRREVGGVQKRYIERMHSRHFDSPRDWFFVDSGLTFDGRNKGATTMHLDAYTGWDTESRVLLTASDGIFTGETDVGDWIVLNYEDEDEDNMLRMEIIEYVSATQVRAVPLRDVPADLRGVTTTKWAIARDTMLGLDHLEGRDVVVLADGFVQGARTVAGGSITLDNPAVIAHAGLPYECWGETLDLNVAGQETIRGRNKVVTESQLLIGGGRGIWAGPSEDRLEQYETRDAEGYQAPPDPIDGLVSIFTSKTWENSGRVVFKQKDPLAMSILAIIPRVELGD